MMMVGELVVHGWDPARAAGQPYAPDDAAALACLEFASGFEPPPDAGAGPFGPPVAVADDAPLMDRLAGILLTAIAVILLVNGFIELVLGRLHR